MVTTKIAGSQLFIKHTCSSYSYLIDYQSLDFLSRLALLTSVTWLHHGSIVWACALLGRAEASPTYIIRTRKSLTYVCMCVCMHVAIRHPHVQHVVCVCAVLQIGKYQQHRARANSNCSSPNQDMTMVSRRADLSSTLLLIQSSY